MKIFDPVECGIRRNIKRNEMHRIQYITKFYKFTNTINISNISSLSVAKNENQTAKKFHIDNVSSKIEKTFIRIKKLPRSLDESNMEK